MGRKMFGGAGPWDEAWTGWWGENPPFHAPVFVLTHHPRRRLSMRGGTTYTFVTGGIESALEQARTAAGEKDVAIAGGASTVQQYLAAGPGRAVSRSRASARRGTAGPAAVASRRDPGGRGPA
jgi:dihydrofolate reductase